MDDLAGKIGEILSNPGAMEQIKSLAGMLGSQAQEMPLLPVRRQTLLQPPPGRGWT